MCPDGPESSSGALPFIHSFIHSSGALAGLSCIMARSKGKGRKGAGAAAFHAAGGGAAGKAAALALRKDGVSVCVCLPMCIPLLYSDTYENVSPQRPWQYCNQRARTQLSCS